MRQSISCGNNLFFFCRFYDLEKWEAKQREKGRMKALKKAQKQKVSIEGDELRHKGLHSGPSRPGKTTIKLNHHHHSSYIQHLEASMH